MRKSNYDKFPAIKVGGELWKGWSRICKELNDRFRDRKAVLVIECYHGVYHDELRKGFSGLDADNWIDTEDIFKAEPEIRRMTYPYVTDDRLFGYRSNFTFADFFDSEKLQAAKDRIKASDGKTVIYGHGAATVAPDADILVYVDMARWEIQMRFRRHEISGLGVDNRSEGASFHYKRGYFVDWPVCDRLKRQLLGKIDYIVDTHMPGEPKMITGDLLRDGLARTARRPFRVVPFFDPAPWGGQWMKEVCGLDPAQDNYGWCFDCVPEENSLYFDVDGERFEMPSNNLVFYRTRDLLGAPVESRFGQDFPIRFDFLDTMGGGNLSLQVHPTTQYIRDTFGIFYTQDESYYLLDAEEGATVFLGLKTGVDPDEMIRALYESQETGKPFDACRYVNQWKAGKHDHYLIPNGTVHCSGAGAMVLEISATPSIFTFKLWDWGRLGLDGLPRPINIRHGANVIQWERQTEFTREQLVNHIQPVAEGEGWREERTGLHENEFIETRRHWFSGPVPHNTCGGVQVINLVEGEEAVVESPTGAFEPFVVHYAETFIVPASVGEYMIRPYGASEGKLCGTIKAYVRFRQ